NPLGAASAGRRAIDADDISLSRKAVRRHLRRWPWEERDDDGRLGDRVRAAVAITCRKVAPDVRCSAPPGGECARAASHRRLSTRFEKTQPHAAILLRKP